MPVPATEPQTIDAFKRKIREIEMEIDRNINDEEALPEKTWEDYGENNENLMVEYADARVKMILNLQNLMRLGLHIIHRAENILVPQREENRVIVQQIKEKFLGDHHRRAKLFNGFIAVDLSMDLPEVQFENRISGLIARSLKY